MEPQSLEESKLPSKLDTNKESNNESKQISERKWLWAYPLIEGVPPSPRGGHTATLTGASLVIFGGHYYGGKEQGYAYLNDVYVLDVNENRWIKPKVSGVSPSPRYKHSAILAGSRIIIFGGRGDKNLAFRDVHALDPMTMTWYQGPEGGGAPTSRYGHSANLVSGTKMFIFGGTNGSTYYNDLYIFDLENTSWTKQETTGAPPQPRQGHASILVGNNLVIHGGFCFDEIRYKKEAKKYGSFLQSCYLNDIRVLDTETFVWSRLRVSGTPPEPRFGHTLDVSDSDIVMFGGWTFKSGNKKNNEAIGEICNYFMVLNTEKMSWTTGKYLRNPPSNRYGHSTTAIGPHLLIFGGWEFNKAQNEVIVLRDCTTSIPSQHESQEEIKKNE